MYAYADEKFNIYLKLFNLMGKSHFLVNFFGFLRYFYYIIVKSESKIMGYSHGLNTIGIGIYKNN